MNSRPPLSEADFHKLVRRVWDDGRTIVPIIGAGVSADSGFPPLASVVRYVAKLACYLQHRFFLPTTTSDIPFPGTVDEFSQRMDKYVSVFGWPDRFQLNADLRGRLAQPERWKQIEGRASSRGGADKEKHVRGKMDLALRLTLDELAEKINPGGSGTLNSFLSRVSAAERNITQMHDELQKLKSKITTAHPDLLNDVNSILSLCSQTTLDLPVENVNSFRYQVVGDWKPLLRHISYYQPELVDALFSSLAKSRKPGTTHIILAHLTQLLRIRTLFTFNFDPFIETALTRENIAHRVYAMEHGIQLPSRYHVDDTVAVIKMHGSTHNILVDERVDYRVSERYREQFRDLVGKSPVFLVMGCSGNDRRLVDLIGDVMTDNRLVNPQTIWVHHKRGDRGPESLQDKITRFGTFDIGQSLQRLFESLTERLPTSTSPYVAHINRPVISNEKPTEERDYAVHSRALTLFLPAEHNENQFPVTSRAFMHSLSRLPLGYTRISIDLEEHHSLEQVVAEIIDQIRRGDSSIPPFVTPGDSAAVDAAKYAKRAAERVAFALRRSRYVLSISGIDAFPFRATTHHGLTRPPRNGGRNYVVDRFNLLCEFLSHLQSEIQAGWSLGDSVLVLHHELPYARHRLNPEEHDSVQFVANTLAERLKSNNCTSFQANSHERANESENSEPNAETVFFLPRRFNQLRKGKETVAEFPAVKEAIEHIRQFDWHIITAAIVSHRRTRTRTGLLQLIKELFGEKLGPAVITVLSTPECLPQWMCWTEEGGLWCDRPARDWVYDFNTQATAADKLKESQNHPCALMQALLAAVIHDRIARNYYLNQFLPSRDPFLFLEYVYHRVSTLRYLCQTQILFASPGAAKKLRDANSHKSLDGDGFFQQLKKYAVADDARGQDTSASERDERSLDAEWSNLFRRLNETLNSRQAGMEGLAAALRALRVRCFRGLHQTWVRSESYLRRALPPDQMIEWCWNLLEYNLDATQGVSNRDRVAIHGMGDEHLNTVFSGNSQRSSNTRQKIQQLVLAEADSTTGILRERAVLVESIRNTLFRSMYAHASYARIVQNDWLCVKDSLDLKQSPEQVHWQLNRKVAELWHAQSSGSFTQDNYTECTKQINRALGERNGPQYAEARLRLFYIQGELALAEFLRETALHEFTPQDERDFDRWRDFWAVTQQNLHLAIEEAREEYPTSNGLMQNPLLEPTADRGLFIPYKALFQIQLGRARLSEARLYATAARAAEKYPEKFPRSSKAESKLISQSKELLKHAYRELAYAKNGIGEENSILLAISDLCSADVALEGSDLAWGEHFLCQDWKFGKIAANQASAKLQTTSGYLSRCWERLLDGPRYVLVWRFFHMSQAEYHIRRILSILDDLTVSKCLNESIDQESLTKRTGELVRRTRICLTGIRFGLDYSPQDSAQAFRERFIRLWTQLCAVSLSTALVLSKVGQAAPLSLLDLLAAAWIDLNLSEDMLDEDTEKLGPEVLTKRLRDCALNQLVKVGHGWDELRTIRQLVGLRDFIKDEFAKKVHDEMNNDELENGKRILLR